MPRRNHPLPATCPNCGKREASYSKRCHWLRHLRECEPLPPSCSKCGQTEADFKSRHGYIQHVKRCKLPVQCPICEKTPADFSNIKGYQKHIQRISCPNERNCITPERLAESYRRGAEARRGVKKPNTSATMRRLHAEQPERWEKAYKRLRGKKRPKHSKTMRENALNNKVGFRDRWNIKRGKVYALINLTPGRTGYKVGVTIKESADVRAARLEGKGYGDWCLGRKQAGKHRDRLRAVIEIECDMPYHVERDIIDRFDNDGEVVFAGYDEMRAAFASAISNHRIA